MRDSERLEIFQIIHEEEWFFAYSKKEKIFIFLMWFSYGTELKIVPFISRKMPRSAGKSFFKFKQLSRKTEFDRRKNTFGN